MGLGLSKFRSIRYGIALLAVLLISACAGEDQIGGLFQELFSVTPKCDVTDKLIKFQNPHDEPLLLVGMAFSAGTNGDGHFSIQGLTIGNGQEIPRDASGGISENTIPAGADYTLRVRYSPLEESGAAVHSAIIDIVYSAPKSGVVQIEVYGQSQGVGDCPEIEEGGAEGLDGPVTLEVIRMIAVTTAINVPLSSDNGIDDFTRVKLNAAINGTIFNFPQITLADNFFLPEPDLTVPGLLPLSVVEGNTFITSAGAVTGTFDAASGHISLPGVKVLLADEVSTLEMTFDPLTTDRVSRLVVPKDRIQTGGFTFDPLDRDFVIGTPIGTANAEEGFLELVGSSVIEKGTGPLAAGESGSIVVRIEAIIKPVTE